MREWFDGLAERERRALLIGALAAATALLYVFLLDPLHQAVAHARVQVQAARHLNEWMHSAAAEAAALRVTAGPAGGPTRHESLLSIIDRSTRAAGLKNAVKRLNPESDRKARLTLEHARFDALINWLIGLASVQGVGIADISIEREDQPGMASAAVTLQLPPPQQ